MSHGAQQPPAHQDAPTSPRRGLYRRIGGLRLTAAGALGLTLIGAIGLPFAGSRTPPTRAVAAATGLVTHPSKVAVLALENRSYGQVIGNRNAPFLNQLARHNALATRYYAITHPSLPNYVALTGGSTGEITRNCTGCDTPGQNLVGQLDKAGVSWKSYFEGLTSNTRPGAVTSTYNPHYNPFVYHDAVTNSTSARSKIVGFQSLHRDLRRGRLARFTWIAPGVRHDGHNGSLRQSDRYAARLVPKVLRALGPNGVLYLTWDEGASKDTRGVNGTTGGGRVALIAAGGAAKKGATTAVPANHYALLRTIEANFGLPALGQAGTSSTPVLAGLLKAPAPR